jgi:thioredoxin 1
MVKLDVDDNPEAAKRFAVSSFPTMLIFKDGQLADPIIGLTSKKMLTGKLDAQLN